MTRFVMYFDSENQFKRLNIMYVVTMMLMTMLKMMMMMMILMVNKLQ